MTAPLPKEAGEGFGGAAQLEIVAGKEQVFVDEADLEVAVVHPFHAQGPAFLDVIEFGDDASAAVHVLADQRGAGLGAGFRRQVELEVVLDQGLEDSGLIRWDRRSMTASVSSQERASSSRAGPVTTAGPVARRQTGVVEGELEEELVVFRGRPLR